MTHKEDGIILIDSLPRCGSTSLARSLSLLLGTNCLIEPFHPLRYSGEYLKLAQSREGLKSAVEAIQRDFALVKHVWETRSLWPFHGKPYLQEELWKNSSFVLALFRRNLLRRYVSSEICRHLHFWIGSRKDFEQRLLATDLPRMNIEHARLALARDRSALLWRTRKLQDLNVPHYEIAYEDLFDNELSARDRLERVKHLVVQSNLTPAASIRTGQDSFRHLDSERYKIFSARMYSLIPGIGDLNEELGCDETGWIFPRDEADCR